MANNKSAEKRNRQNAKRAARNRVVRGSARTAVKKARLAIASGADNAQELVQAAESALDRAASKGVIHRNNASRRKSRLYQALNKTAAE
ncbi:MAG: 30S ribosomal protein S20 [Chloroflexi bacterium]|nr:MAG: 30S ribosomal protein S20 [Chloroflexota bacterium]